MSVEADKAVVAALLDAIAEAVGETHYAERVLTGKVLDAIADSVWLAELLAERDQAQASVAAVRELVEHREQRYTEHGGIRAVPVADLRRALDRHAVTHAGTEAHSLARKPPGGGGGHTPGVGWMCTGCEWRFSYDVPEQRAREVWSASHPSGGASW